MAIIHYGTSMGDGERRARLYAGELFLLPPTAEGVALCEHARCMVEEAFQPLDARTAQHEMPVERYAALLSELKPAFIHHPESKRLIQELLHAVGCELEDTYFDVPRLRTSTSDGTGQARRSPSVPASPSSFAKAAEPRSTAPRTPAQAATARAISSRRRSAQRAESCRTAQGP